MLKSALKNMRVVHFFSFFFALLLIFFCLRRFKCYPVIIDGSWILKQMVPNVPTLLGMKVPITYWKGRNYIEIGVQCDKNYLAQSILSIAFPIAKKLTVDQCYILQSESEEELPEVVFAGNCSDIV